jgi:hypothetical protein
VSTEKGVQSAIAPETCHDIPRLLLLFAGLGENCDFGVVQRAVGIEPFGLFRFAACNATDLGDLLRTRFRRLAEPEDLWLEEGPRGEYWVKSRHCSFAAHTDRYVGRDDPLIVLGSQIEKARYLKAKLIRDLSRGRKLFVFKGETDITAIREIVVQLRTYGPNWLVWVCVADAAHLPGSVERLSEGLLRGFVSRFGTYDGDPSLPVEEWVAVCANAYRLSRNAEPPEAPVYNLISPEIATCSLRWSPELCSGTRLLDEPDQSCGVMFEHRLETADATSVYRALVPIASGGDFVFSAWVRIPEGFRGRQIGALLPGFSSIAMWIADLKSRNNWQRVWVTANLPIDAHGIACDILAEGAVGDNFQSAYWCLERGNRPLGYGFNRSGVGISLPLNATAIRR